MLNVLFFLSLMFFPISLDTSVLHHVGRNLVVWKWNSFTSTKRAKWNKRWRNFSLSLPQRGETEIVTVKHRKTEGSDTLRSCSMKTFIGTLSNTPLSLSRTIVIEAIADGSVPLETSCLSSTRTRSASCSILDLLDPSCTLSPFSIILLPNRFDIFARPTYSCFSLIFFFFFVSRLSFFLV